MPINKNITPHTFDQSCQDPNHTFLKIKQDFHQDVMQDKEEELRTKGIGKNKKVFAVT